MYKVLFFLLATFSCFAESVGTDERAFALSLYSKLNKGDENTAVSPYGIFSNLSLLYLGAEDETAQQFRSALHISGSDERFQDLFQKQLQGLTRESEKGYSLYIANALFPHKGTHILTNYQKIAREIFDARVDPIDFASKDAALVRINNWIADNTGGQITDLVQEEDISPLTRLVVTNAVYFEGEWTSPFEEKNTSQELFYPQSGTGYPVNMMNQMGRFSYYDGGDFQVLSLPFRKDRGTQPPMECLILLPKDGDLNRLEDRLKEALFDEILAKKAPAQLSIVLPKFRFSKRVALNPILEKMGIKDAFTYQADFSGIDGLRDLFLNKVLHETYFDLDEVGVTAAAATAACIGLKSLPPQKDALIPFRADHPFLFLIIDTQSKSILFMGRLAKPEGVNGS